MKIMKLPLQTKIKFPWTGGEHLSSSSIYTQLNIIKNKTYIELELDNYD